MAFQQLYYTSCEHGLGGYGGYQFNAVTPGTPPGVLREVEERTVYQAPDALADEPEACPVAFSYTVSEQTGVAIAAQATFAGTDYSGRPGNYFVHALATSTPAADFGPVLPAELWDAPLWQRRPVAETELPELPGPPPRGIVDRAAAQAFLDARDARDLLPELLTAAAQALSGQPPVLLVSEDATETAWWIAAVGYLLGEPLARRLTFTTYSHRPGYTRYHLTGVLPDTMPPDAGTGLVTFDFAAGVTPGGAAHPLATLLAGTGVLACAGLWHQAAAFAAGTERDLDDWLAPVALAAGLLGRTLSGPEAGAVAGWLPVAANWLSPQLIDVGLGTVRAASGQLTDGQLAQLLALARRHAPVRAEDFERLLTERRLIASVAAHRAEPLRAFDEITDLRATAGRTPRVDATLLGALWPHGCPPDTLTELLGVLAEPDADEVGADVPGWFAAEVARLPDGSPAAMAFRAWRETRS